MKAPLTYLLTFGLGLAACFGAQTILLRRSAGRSVKSESNFFSTIARLQVATRDEPQVLLLGSSMTGRLPDRSRGFPGVANMGCDGGSAVEILHAIDRGELPAAPLIVIEGNTIVHGFELAHAPAGSAGNSVAREIPTWTFRAGSKAPNFGAAGRPSALAYSTLMERKLGAADASSASALQSSTHPVLPESAVPEDVATLSDSGNTDLDELAAVIRRLSAKGSRLAVVMLPGAPVTPENLAAGRELARRGQISFWDLGSGISKDAVTLTDGVHMAPASAAAAMKSILQELSP